MRSSSVRYGLAAHRPHQAGSSLVIINRPDPPVLSREQAEGVTPTLTLTLTLTLSLTLTLTLPLPLTLAPNPNPSQADPKQLAALQLEQVSGWVTSDE